MGSCAILLHPQDLFKHRADNMSHRSRKFTNSRRSKRILTKRNTEVVSKNLVMGHVKLLKRGQVLEESSVELNHSGSNPKSTSQKVVLKSEEKDLASSRSEPIECYAGYGIQNSPSPSLVPLPTFL
ncbi:hypothetical protein HanXRQr2_Chr13g0588741 [Helianthus annuus]|uniref:Uncharacterized protein n=1 Tax=Helianthus annuus TaxID=4232 RepID=A0A9K3EI89_HELAN|nr:hypothetical protein HanXRQr2_Chr13g0588741 [Helianthus annuus]KAJ0481294.1 hypothetical protein HanIR_Chr13g0641031 [Helianthus annuus]KAJ0497762.1 hypothetical protein HanHA89_Chr13g0514861 [Helianthus annuus]